MIFENLRVKDVHLVVRYNTNKRRWRAENRRDHIIGIKLCGDALHDFGYRKFVLSRNNIFFFNQRDSYDVEVYEPGESLSIHFTTYDEVDIDSCCIPITGTGEIISILNKAETAHRAGDEMKLLSLVYRLCAEFNKLCDRAYTRTDERVLAAKKYIDAHFTDADCLERAVEECGLSARRFGELFRTAFDVTPNRYIVTCRIERAKELLTFSDMSIADVSAACGFCDVYYFSKVFKRECGVCPSNFCA